MNTVDIILLICFIPAIIQGLRKGFIAQAISIVSIVAGIWASARFADMVTAWASQYIAASEQVLKIVAFAIILIAVFVVLGLLGKLLEGVFKLVMLGWVNKLLGVVFSALKTILIAGLILSLIGSITITSGLITPEVMENSVLYGPIKHTADVIFPYIKNLLTIK